MSKQEEMEFSLGQLKELFKASANGNTVAGKELAQAITVPILQQVRLASLARQLFSVQILEPGAQASYPIADDLEAPVWILPKVGYVPQNFVEAPGEEVYVPTFRIASSMDWSIIYARDGRVDIAQRAMRTVVRAIIDYEEESAWRLLMPAVTSNFPGKGLLGPRPAPIVEITGGPAAGFLSKELINQMKVRMERNDRTLTDLYVSPEDMADIAEWGESQVDEFTRRDIFLSGGMNGILGVKLHKVRQLGATGKYNINGNTSQYGIFRANGSQTFSDLVLSNPNVVDANGAVTTPGETQILGFDLTSNDSLVMPIRKELEFYDDTPNLFRSGRAGFFCDEEVGLAILDTRMLCMGIIDRSI